MVDRASPTKHDVFISYHTDTDSELAKAIERGLEQYNKPFLKIRAMRVFRDGSALNAGSRLRGQLADILEHTRWFVFLASPIGEQLKATEITQEFR